MRYRFGGFVLDTAAGSLLRDDGEVRLQPRTYELLLLMVQRPGELVRREELLDALWPGVCVTPNSLEQVVSRARRALRPETPLRTVPRRGYRFDATVVIEQPAEASPDPTVPRTGNLHGDDLPIFGRDLVITTLVDRLWQGVRLLTLIGPGGAGKTTLARHVALRALDETVTGWFVDLSAAETEADLVRTTAGVLELQLDPSSPVEQVGLALGRLGPALVVLDNFEQLAPFAATTVGRWLRDAPEVAFVVTSRVVLEIRGEHVVPVEPLPPRDGALLLVDRAGLPGPDPDVVALAEALEGLPLALELAARRLRTMSPAALLARLQERFSLLVDPRGDRPERHRSLEAALQDSWELLQPAERLALGQITVFAGTFHLHAAERVIRTGRHPLDVLQGLGDQSLIRVLPGDRFALLHTIRAFAFERTEPAEIEAAERRHGEWFARHRRAKLQECKAIAPELDDLIAACRRAIRREDARTAVDCALGAMTVLKDRGPLDLGISLLEGALTLSDPADRVDLMIALGEAHLTSHPVRAMACFVEALEHTAGTPRGGVVLLDLATSLQHQGLLDRAERAYRDAIEQLQSHGDRYNEGLALTRLGGLLSRRGRSNDALHLHEQAVAIFQEIGDVVGLATATTNLAIVLDDHDQPDLAEQRFREALDLQERAGRLMGQENVRGNLAIMLARAGRLDEALVELQGALTLARQLGALRSEAMHLQNLGALHIERGELDEAGRALSEALLANQRLGRELGEAHTLLGLGSLHRRRKANRAAADAVERAVDLLDRSTDQRLRVTAYVERATLRFETGERDGARQDLDQARRIVQAGAGLDGLTRSRLEELERRLGTAPG